ncbi:carbohydrate-binding module family 1 protein [Athelia psychrophila]|uniref:Carbohydrate-binding module family 1 protein n=1 Tax=Athelia psychrophila TaxID=1759441 RepID=A0A166W291_9AGAM|nr:carbohydrate-binding module family 1 protein [Fibularhizoctonia sp. CBS 109695]
MLSLLQTALLCVSLPLAVIADETIYSNSAISSTWQDWSWGSTINYAATDILAGTTGSSISVNSTAYSALSLYDTASFSSYAGLSFDLAGDPTAISFYISDSVDSNNSATIPLTAWNLPATTSTFTTYLLNFAALPPNGASLGNDSWNRVSWQAGGSGAVYHLDNIVLVSSIVTEPLFLSAEPLANNIIAVTTQGAVNLSAVEVTLNGKSVPITGNTTVIPVDTPSKSITYLTLESNFAAGSLSITAPNATFSYVLPASLAGTINQAVNHPISPLVYGMNFPTDAAYITELGITISRWGGNAVTAYNPFGGFTNAGNDWYFENRANDDADDWIEWVHGAGSASMVTIPALDWVSKDATSYSYPKTLYPDQESFDSYLPDAGDGLLPNGSYAEPPPAPTTAYTPWNGSMQYAWLNGLVNKPTIVTVDNEIEIASNTHQDMHPSPMGYDEELWRVLNTSTVAKGILPNVLVAAPSTCAWWYYWTSSIGLTDNAAHNNTDFLPWFLQQMQTHDKIVGQRFLDYLDIHYYFAADTSANDAAAKALRLRMTRSWWDTTYVDESWIGTSTPQNTQPNATIVQLIPRMQALIAKYYPGTKLSVGEWSSTDDTDITGGLVTVDSLGIFGRYKLDSATYWSGADPAGPVGLAYWLYRGQGTYFGSSSASVSIPQLNPDTLGVYAGTNGGSNASLVIVNKDPSNPVALNLTGLPSATYLIRHFGGEAGVAKYQTEIALEASTYLVVPAYTAVYLQEITPCSKLYYQCGGLNWKGSTCCVSPSVCVPIPGNKYYSQCQAK